MMNPTQQFYEKWFPIIARHARTDVDLRDSRVQWFDNIGLTQSYPFVVRVFLHYGRLEELNVPGPGCVRTVARGYDGLIVELHAHGVGKLIEEWFMFEKFLQTRSPARPLDPNWQKFFIEEESPPGSSPRWHCHEPANIRELLDPVERYIELWLSENPAAAMHFTNKVQP